MTLLVALVASLSIVMVAMLFVVSLQDGNYVSAAMLAVMLFAVLIVAVVAWRVTLRGMP